MSKGEMERVERGDRVELLENAYSRQGAVRAGHTGIVLMATPEAVIVKVISNVAYGYDRIVRVAPSTLKSV